MFQEIVRVFSLSARIQNVFFLENTQVLRSDSLLKSERCIDLGDIHSFAIPEQINDRQTDRMSNCL